MIKATNLPFLYHLHPKAITKITKHHRRYLGIHHLSFSPVLDLASSKREVMTGNHGSASTSMSTY